MHRKRRAGPTGRPDAGVLGRALARSRRRIDEFRIREHLRRAERDLRRRDASHLEADRRRRRTRQLDGLRDYWQAGTFPTNRESPERVPCFVGADGTRCAVGHLAERDGRSGLVRAVASADNTVRIEDLDDDHPLVEWVERAGVTRAEAARIQPSYATSFQFATTCGPVSCRTAGLAASVAALAVVAALEYVGYRVAGGLFPGNALRRRATLAYLTVLNLLIAPFLAALLYALFP